MAFEVITLEQRIKENIKNYNLSQLYTAERAKDSLEKLCALTGAEVLLTDRHGVSFFASREFEGITKDTEKEPGLKIRIMDRTIAHMYLKLDNVAAGKKELVQGLFEDEADNIRCYCSESYQRQELDNYSDELEELCQRKRDDAHNNKEDILTGVLNRSYFYNRRQIVDRSEVIPVTQILININDWKVVYDTFGAEESDRLIRVVAEIVKQYAKPDYIIGRTDGDAFTVLIPMAEENEAENYAAMVRNACNNFDDVCLAPSVAIGVVVKTNVEEHLDELYSDAEYNMFEDKYKVKNAPGYKERLEEKLKGR